MTIGQQIPHILFSRIDHRRSYYDGCECQQCTPTLYKAALRDPVMARELFEASKGGNVPGITEDHRFALARFFQQVTYRSHPHMSAPEARIVERLIDDLLAAGYLLRVYDGEEYATKRTLDKDALWAALASTAEDYLFVYEQGRPQHRIGWVRLIWGNNVDVISDYTINLAGEGSRTGEPNLLAGANALAEQIDAEAR